MLAIRRFSSSSVDVLGVVCIGYAPFEACLQIYSMIPTAQNHIRCKARFRTVLLRFELLWSGSLESYEKPLSRRCLCSIRSFTI